MTHRKNKISIFFLHPSMGSPHKQITVLQIPFSIRQESTAKYESNPSLSSMNQLAPVVMNRFILSTSTDGLTTGEALRFHHGCAQVSRTNAIRPCALPECYFSSIPKCDGSCCCEQKICFIVRELASYLNRIVGCPNRTKHALRGGILLSGRKSSIELDSTRRQ